MRGRCRKCESFDKPTDKRGYITCTLDSTHIYVGTNQFNNIQQTSKPAVLPNQCFRKTMILSNFGRDRLVITINQNFRKLFPISTTDFKVIT